MSPGHSRRRSHRRLLCGSVPGKSKAIGESFALRTTENVESFWSVMSHGYFDRALLPRREHGVKGEEQLPSPFGPGANATARGAPGPPQYRGALKRGRRVLALAVPHRCR